MRKRSNNKKYDEYGESLDDILSEPFSADRLPALPDGYVWRSVDKWPNWRYVVPLDKNKAPRDTEYHRMLWVHCQRGKMAAGLIPADPVSPNGYWLSKKYKKAEIISLLAKRRLGL